MTRHLLIVDDYPEALEIFEEMFRLQGYEVLTALDSIGAEAQVLASNVRTVVIDDDPMGTPAQALLECLASVGAVAQKVPFRAIALRGYRPDGKKEPAVGFDFTLYKPLNFNELDLAVSQCMDSGYDL